MSIMEQMLGHHGFCELEIVVLFYWFYNDSGAIGRGHKQLEANPSGDATSRFDVIGASWRLRGARQEKR